LVLTSRSDKPQQQKFDKEVTAEAITEVTSEVTSEVTIIRGAPTMDDRARGTVKWFNNARGYGFITQEEAKEAEAKEAQAADIFVHYRNIRGSGFRSLAEGQEVEFEMQEGEKGLQADDVVCI
jgi:CspA family cold shock protein